MKHFSSISTLIIDFGGVLIDLSLKQCVENLKRLGVESVDGLLNNYNQNGFFLQFEKGQISAAEFRNEIRKFSVKELTDKQIDDAWMSFLLEIPTYKLDILFELRKKFRIVMLSNTNSIHFETAKENRFNYRGRTIDHYFDKFYLSYEMKMAKPDAEIFETLLKEEGIAAHNCLFLDDGAKNILNASQLGIQTYLVDPTDDLSFLLDKATFFN
jgi:putative hydrolase of the HAD superfamily